MATQQVPTPKGVFTRASSGLVRTVGPGDTGLYGLIQIVIGYAIFIVAVWPLYDGASMELAMLITIVGSVALGLCYALLAAVYPRSGGEYVILSRTTHPSIGFATSWTVAFWEAYYLGVNGAFVAFYGFAPMFKVLGLQTGEQGFVDLGSWFESSWGMFLTSLTLIVAFGYLVYLGMRTYFRVQRWVAYIALTSVAITILVLALGRFGVLDFQSNFDELAGPGAYQDMLQGASAAEIDTAPAFSLVNTLNFMIWPAFSILFATLAVSFSGEIKNVRRSHLVGINGAMVVGGTIMLALMFFVRGAAGNEFMIASSVDPELTPLPVDPWVNVIAAITGGNALLSVLVTIWVPLFIAYTSGVVFVYCSRAILAWGLDGLVPERMAHVNERHHSPTYAIIATAIAGVICVATFAFTDLVTILSGLVGFGLGFSLMAIVGLLFPFLKKDVYETSPAAIRVGGFPLISIAGAIATVFVLYVVVRSAIDPTFGANTPFSLWTNGVVVVGGFVWFFVARSYWKSKGVDIDRRFKQIPVE